MKRTQEPSAGFTITELLVATGLMSAFFLVGASVIQNLFQFQKDVNARMMDNFSLVSFHRSMITDLQGSYWHRFGAFTCPTSKAVMDTASTASATLSNGGKFEFITSDFSSTVGNVPNSSQLAVANMRNLAVGDFVLLSFSADPTEPGLFIVRTVDRNTNRITVDSTSLAVGGSDCTFSLPARAITDFFGSSASSNVIITRIKVIQYAITEGELTRSSLPGGEGEKVLEKMNRLRINSAWTKSSDSKYSKDKNTGKDYSKMYGQMKYQVLFDYNQSTLMGSTQTSRQQQTIAAQYTLDSFQYLNRSFTSGSAPISAVFPTCSVGYNFRPGALSIDTSEEEFQNTIPISITGFVSTDKVKGATIDVMFTPSGGASITCFKHNPDQGQYPKPGDPPLKYTGIRENISLSQEAAGFETYTCAARGSIEIQATMTFFSTDINQTKTIPCSAESIEAPTRYRFAGSRPSCDEKWATWDMGTEIFGTTSDGVSVSMGRFGVDINESCLWEGQNPDGPGFDFNSNFGRADNCDWSLHRGKKLKRIYLRPYKQQVYKADLKTAIFPEKGAYIECD